jgi:hypothetical protein
MEKPAASAASDMGGQSRRRQEDWQLDAGVQARGFAELCERFCDLLKVPQPELRPDAHGRFTFNVVMRGTIVNIVHCPSTSADHAFVLFELGPVGKNGPGSYVELQVLLEANFVLQLHPSTFSRNPSTGEAVMQRTYALHDMTASLLYELLGEGVESVCRWREVLDVRDAGSHRTHDPQAPPLAMFNLA